MTIIVEVHRRRVGGWPGESLPFLQTVGPASEHACSSHHKNAEGTPFSVFESGSWAYLSPRTKTPILINPEPTVRTSRSLRSSESVYKDVSLSPGHPPKE
jgi:hypothetical protein